MGDGSKIEWTDASWNPIRGCSAVSPGCANCYAAEVAARFSGVGQAYEGLAVRGPRARWSGKVRLVPEHLADPLRWQRPRRVFVNSMSDLFHESLPFSTIAAVFGVMASADRHVFQVLTKRADRMLDWFRWLSASECSAAELCRGYASSLLAGSSHPHGAECCHDERWPLPNVWLGVSTEDQQRADERIPLLLQCPAAVRWISAEPLLGPIDLVSHLFDPEHCCWNCGADVIRGPGNTYEYERSLLETCVVCGVDLEGRHALDWVVVGGESGSRARVCDLDWIGRIALDCQDHGVPVFVKQLGSEVSVSGSVVSDVRRSDGSAPAYGARGRFVYAHSKGGDLAEFPSELRVRQYPAVDRSLPCSAAVPR